MPLVDVKGNLTHLKGMSKISLADFSNLIETEIPLCRLFGISALRIGPLTDPDAVSPEPVEEQGADAVLRLDPGGESLRPGGTVSGPTMMALADVAMYGAVLSRVGRVPLAVTTDFSIHFLRKPDVSALLAHAHILKAGRRLTVMRVAIRMADDPTETGLVAHATGTYSTPPDAGGAASKHAP